MKRIFSMALLFIIYSFCKDLFAEPLTLAAATLLSAGITGGTQILGTGISAWMNYNAMNRQADEDRRVEALGIKREDEVIARSEKWTRKQFKVQEEQRNLNNALTMKMNLWDQIARNDQFKTNMIAIQRGRRV